MHKRILLLYSAREAGETALRACMDLAIRHQTEVVVLAVSPPTSLMIGWEVCVYDREHEEKEQRRNRAEVENVRHRLLNQGYLAKAEVIVGDADMIGNFAREHHTDLIIVGHKHIGSALSRWWNGSNYGAILRASPCNVLCVVA